MLYVVHLILKCFSRNKQNSRSFKSSSHGKFQVIIVIKVALQMSAFVFNISSCWKIVSDNLFLRGVKINPPVLKRRSTGAELGKRSIVLQKPCTNIGIARTDLQILFSVIKVIQCFHSGTIFMSVKNWFTNNSLLLNWSIISVVLIFRGSWGRGFFLRSCITCLLYTSPSPRD